MEHSNGPVTEVKDAARSAATRVEHLVDEEIAEYSAGAERPLRSYAAFIATYAGAIATGTALAHRRGVKLPARIRVGDLTLLAIATHKLSRLVTKDSITAVVRAPFTEFVEPIGAGEVNEKPRGTGIRHALGELFGCPFCIGQWIGTAFVGGFVVAPRPTRAVASVFTVVAVSDWLQYGHAALQQAQK